MKNEEALVFMEGLKRSYEKQAVSCNRKMAKYEPTKMGYKDAKDLKDELERRIDIINYIIGVIKK